MSDWRTEEGPAADETAGPWLLLEAWSIALGLGALTVWGLSAKA